MGAPDSSVDVFRQQRPAVPKENGMLWIAIDGAPHKTYVDVCKASRLYVARLGSCNYKVCAVVGDADICLKSGIGNESEAQDWLDHLVKNVMS